MTRGASQGKGKINTVAGMHAHSHYKGMKIRI